MPMSAKVTSNCLTGGTIQFGWASCFAAQVEWHSAHHGRTTATSYHLRHKRGSGYCASARDNVLDQLREYGGTFSPHHEERLWNESDTPTVAEPSS